MTEGRGVSDVLYSELSYSIVGAAMEVHKALGPGFLESVYHTAMNHELGLQAIPFEPHKSLPVMYKGVMVGSYVADIVVDEKIVVELKAVQGLVAAHLAQAHHYLAATGLRLALVINFGHTSLETKRVIR